MGGEGYGLPPRISCNRVRPGLGGMAAVGIPSFGLIFVEFWRVRTAPVTSRGAVFPVEGNGLVKEGLYAEAAVRFTQAIALHKQDYRWVGTGQHT